MISAELSEMCRKIPQVRFNFDPIIRYTYQEMDWLGDFP